MNGLFRNYFPNRGTFYNLFDEAAENLVNMAVLLKTFVNSEVAEEREAIFNKINRLENVGDDITHKIYLALDKVIFTPISRSNIPVLASSIDDVADTIHEASGRMYLYNITAFVTPIKEIAELILKASEEIQKVVGLLKVSKSSNSILTSCRQIKNYEHQSDQIYYHSVAELFENEKDAINLIKYREILSSLESTVNRCKNASEALEAILFNSL